MIGANILYNKILEMVQNAYWKELNGYNIIIGSMDISHLASTVTIFLFIIAVANYGFKHSDVVSKVKMYILNEQVMWSITARFEKDDHADFEHYVFERIKNFFINDCTHILKSNECSLDKNITNTFVYCCAGLTFQVNSTGYIFIQMREYHAPYRDSKKLLSKKIVPLLTSLKQLIENEVPKSKLRIGYSCKIKFDGKNPYMGQYLSKDRDLDLKTFNCVLEGKDDLSKVEIHTDNFEFQSNDLTNLVALLDEHLSLGGY